MAVPEYRRNACLGKRRRVNEPAAIRSRIEHGWRRLGSRDSCTPHRVDLVDRGLLCFGDGRAARFGTNVEENSEASDVAAVARAAVRPALRSEKVSGDRRRPRVVPVAARVERLGEEALELRTWK